MPRGKLQIVPEHADTRMDMLSDWVQAEKAVLWDLRAEGLNPQLQAYGLTMEELEELLLNLAADVHTHRTGIRAGAVIIEDGMVGPLHHVINYRLEMAVPSDAQKMLADQLRGLYEKKALR